MREDDACRPTFLLTTLLGLADARHVIESSTNILETVCKLRLPPVEWTAMLPSRLSLDMMGVLGLSLADGIDMLLSRPLDCFGSDTEAFCDDPRDIVLKQSLLPRSDGESVYPEFVDSRLFFMQDGQGRVFSVQVVDSCEESFLLEAATRTPDLVFSPRSPIWPTYDAVWYDEAANRPHHVSMPAAASRAAAAPSACGTRRALKAHGAGSISL